MKVTALWASRTGVFRAFCALALIALLGSVPFQFVAAAPPDKEKGQQCSDGLDNDGDLLIDGEDPDCQKSGDTTTTESDIQYHVQVLTESGANAWSPDPALCAAYTVPGDTNFRVRFPRHMQCAEECWIDLNLIGGHLTDDIALNLSTRKGKFTGFAISGQDTIGKEGIMHESDEVSLDMPVPEYPEEGFEIAIDSDVTIYQLSGHLAGRRVETAGVIHVGSLIYTPCGGELKCPATWPVEEPELCP